MSLGEQRLLVAVADTPARRAQGLMGVRRLGSLDGMLFVFPTTRPVSFWMKETLIPLDLFFFDSGGRLLEVVEMTPCTSDPCPSYRSAAPVRWALEVPAGTLAVPPGTQLTLP